METIYISEYLAQTNHGKPVYDRIKEVLKKPRYNLQLINNYSNNEWCRDYMPLHASDGKLVKFKYEPIYLMETKKWKRTIPKVDDILSDLNIEVADTCDLKLDGGAIEIFGKTGIISNRVIIENQPMTEVEICDTIKNKLQLDRIIIIPIHPDDFTGHVDGAVRFINENTVLINYDKDVLDNAKLLHTYKRQLIEQFFYSLRMSLYNTGLKWEYLTYVEGKQKDEKDPKNNFNLYLNFLNLENLILMPSYGMDKYDDMAKADLERYYSKEVVKINAKALSKKGGMINCVTWDY
ncbi:MAG TPA: hypothetical protein ENH49_04420 [Candidatus Marinimicrobia bacterium]|nr:hypothetical protein [Candidatus Neomarinimicrobiota bacterium]